MNKFKFNKGVSDFQNQNKKFYLIALALFILVTAYFGMLYMSFGKKLNELIVPYVLILLVLVIIILIGNFRTIIYENYENYKLFPNLRPVYTHDGNILDHQQKMEKEMKIMIDSDKFKQCDKETPNVDKEFKHSKKPLSKIYNIDELCDDTKCAKIDKLYHPYLKEQCKQRDIKKLKDNSLLDDSEKVMSSVKFPLRYDGIYNI